jgi:hypothetical protein
LENLVKRKYGWPSAVGVAVVGLSMGTAAAAYADREPTPAPVVEVVAPSEAQPNAETGTTVVAVGDCSQPLDGTFETSTTVTPWTQEYVLVAGEWVLGERVEGEPYTTTTRAIDPACEPPASAVPKRPKFAG